MGIVENLNDILKYLNECHSNLPAHVFETLGEIKNDIIIDDKYQNDLEKLRKENTELKNNIIELRKSLDDAVNMIFELTAMDEDCPCGGDCGCSGDDCLETTIE